ncbi:hypothetical protein VTK73DRAFT_2565 [Phialemonium thermophilum]|uniref:ATP-dependent RNA helicase n=1 Tax=Phialemonium thermophilum TaxID=223376 RepID=A0ABR3VRZ4_9PEZI
MNDKGKKPKESRLGGQDQGESDQPRKKKHPDKDKENTGEENINGDGTGLAERAEGTRKSKKKKERTVVDDDTEPQLEPKSAQHAIPSDTKKREKKKDKNKVKKGAERRDEDGHGSDSLDESQKKHKAVFERKEKSLKRRAAVKASDDVNKAPGETTGDGEGGAPPDEAVEVHGLEPLPQPDPVNFDGVKPSYETLPPWLAHPIRGDVVVAAATGSGKTLAYVLPMVRDISEGVVTRLRGLIVVPTRELVRQAQESCELCAGVFSGPGRKRVRVGISMGSQTLRQEQAALMEEEQVYDPAGYEAWKRANETVDIEDPEDELPTPAGPANVARPLPNHVIRHVSKVDILICTPGRLVEHIKQTPGFTLDYVRWLVVDEADKLLSQSFQQWLDVSGVRKVVLSATMTRDLSLLNSLKLQRPKLVVLEGPNSEDLQEGRGGVEGEHVLPGLLKEAK